MGELEHMRRTRDGYDSAAAQYLQLFGNSLREYPLDDAMIGAFADLVRGGSRPVLDVGCGPGYVTDRLRALGVRARGLDLSSEMVALARETFPDIEFEQGRMAEVALPDGSLDGLLSRSSIIHTPPGDLPAVFAEFHRLLAPGGHLLLTFQAHVDDAELAWPFDHKVAPAYRWSVGRVAALLREAGLQETARMVVAPELDPIRGFHYGHLLFRKPVTESM
ncbi:class I SAM-dependent DNA methyltransferase [Glycomyces harbinensis]|uniref:Methyltransferase domain-containing protein n=1 Tax=Glycomyces harbinensis TaxID=58114 RepID=A0A1G7BYT4_9ACTN|nr:class I SAM-dependent methyltransferase [Glycomyces harbinensis]SDE32199.1 Methyltransferase domain-containing protein [Glycomyces harbinensis]